MIKLNKINLFNLNCVSFNCLSGILQSILNKINNFSEFSQFSNFPKTEIEHKKILIQNLLEVYYKEINKIKNLEEISFDMFDKYLFLYKNLDLNKYIPNELFENIKEQLDIETLLLFSEFSLNNKNNKNYEIISDEFLKDLENKLSKIKEKKYSKILELINFLLNGKNFDENNKTILSLIKIIINQINIDIIEEKDFFICKINPQEEFLINLIKQNNNLLNCLKDILFIKNYFILIEKLKIVYLIKHYLFQIFKDSKIFNKKIYILRKLIFYV